MIRTTSTCFLRLWIGNMRWMSPLPNPRNFSSVGMRVSSESETASLWDATDKERRGRKYNGGTASARGQA